MKKAALLFIALSFVTGVYGQSLQLPRPVETTAEFIQTAENGHIRCTQVIHDASQDEQMARNAAASGLHILTETIGRKGQSTGLDIVLRSTAQLDGFPAAKQAFINAAARWEAIILSPVKVIIDVDYGPTRFGTAYSSANVIGSTSTPNRTATNTVGGGGTSVSFRVFADSLKSRNPGYGDFYDSIPSPMPNALGTNPSPSGGLPTMQALGFYPALTADAVAFGQTPNIGFNSAFAFDLDPSDGVTASQIDFDGTAVHEMGHALGFLSSVGGSGSTLYAWDIFRFRPGIVTDNSSFKNATRINTPGPSSTGGDQVFWDGVREWEVSTATSGQAGGDGNQASHWRANENRTAFPLEERTIGVMDPTAAFGEREIIRVADIKMLSIIGWQMDFGAYTNLISPVTVVTTKSDYTTPTAISLGWKNPVSFYNGTTLANWKVVVLRNGVSVKEYVSPSAGATIAYKDSGLVQYGTYTYRVIGVYTTTGDSGMAVSRTVVSGGSPVPALASSVSISSNGSTAILKFTSPTKHEDQTLLHNLAKVKIYRGSDFSKPLDSLVLAVTDTGKTFMITDTPPSKLSPVYSYYVAFVGAAATPREGNAAPFPTARAGAILGGSYTENFETNRQFVVSDALWDSTNIVAHAGTYALGALSYPNNANASAYLPLIIGAGSPTLSFWTICRTEAGADFGLVEASRNHGRTWDNLLTLSESTHPEWQAGTNTWFQHNISLASYATDTILVRFRLTSNASVGKFGWLVDDIVLSPVATGVKDTHPGIPSEYSLIQNYPNPFNPSTEITYSLKTHGEVSLKVYDLLGRTVAEVVHSAQDAGWYSVRFDASTLSSGIYYYELRANEFVAVKKMMLLR